MEGGERDDRALGQEVGEEWGMVVEVAEVQASGRESRWSTKTYG